VKVLITGVAGFVGNHMAEFLRTERPGVEVFGIVLPHGASGTALPGGVAVIEADLEDAPAVDAALDLVHPDRIIHLAAQSSPQASWSDPAGTFRTNVLGLLNVLEAVRKRALSPRILVIGSAEEYGMVDARDLPVDEETALRPATPYAVSKVAQGYLALQYALAFHMGIVRTRTFHHTGPGRGEAFAESSFARQIAEIESGRRPAVMAVGNLEVVRDFSDVRDVVRAYWALLESGDAGAVYNVCSGKGTRIRDLLHTLIEAAGIDVEVRVDPELVRPADVPAMVGDPTRLRDATGWAPRIPLRQTLGDLLQYWRERTAAAPRSPVAPRPR
jgi:GDP-4-dehydro-6-deoxy-D-mannose reductase